MAFPLLVGGCGGGRQSADVSGRVVRDGKPVANVVVRFQPMVSDNRRDVGMASYGKTDSDGRFRLRFSDNDSSGALIGSHAVIIDDPSEHAADNADAGGIGKELKSQLLSKWTDGSTRYEVKNGKNDALFELTN